MPVVIEKHLQAGAIDFPEEVPKDEVLSGASGKSSLSV
jgi:hypothetical protein